MSEMQVSTIRATTTEERDALAAARQPRFRYVVVDPEDGQYWRTYGILVQGGYSKAEAVFWAERLQSKSDVRYVPPAGWEAIEGKFRR